MTRTPKGKSYFDPRGVDAKGRFIWGKITEAGYTYEMIYPDKGLVVDYITGDIETVDLPTLICKNCGEKVRYSTNGLHFTDNGWYHDGPDNFDRACIASYAEPTYEKERQ